MHLDLISLLLISQLVSLACGLMFALDSAHGKTSFSIWFAAAFLSAPAASIFYLLAQAGENCLWAFPVGNAIATLTVALTWIGARSVNARSLPYPIAVVAPALIAAIVLVAGPVDGPWTGALPFFLSFSAFSALACTEFWRGGIKEPRLWHGTVLAIVCGIVAFWYMARAVGLIALGPNAPVFEMLLGPEAAAVLLIVMIVVASLSLVAIGRELALNLARELAGHDDLTNLLNRREFFRRIEELSGRNGKHVNSALLLFDLDHFKSINDTHGHLVGDEVLVAFARIAREGLRSQDLLCRYGGEEFAALLPGATVSEAFETAERIRHEFAASDAGALARVRPTTSIGIAGCGGSSVPLFELLDQADQALYRAKSEGRNKAVAYTKTWSMMSSGSASLHVIQQRAAG
jgi:diguanylate cyclase (GGDEF)-like protein